MYWNEEVEVLPAARLRVLESAKLSRQLRYVYEHSPFYREQFDHAGVTPEAITGIEALQLLPFTEKRVLAQAQVDGALFGPHQCAPVERIVRVVGTGGTSGQPIRLGWTQADIHTYNEMGARALWTMGCRPSDFVVNCFNYSLYAGGIMDHEAFETLGATILPYSVGQSRRLLDTLAQIPTELSLYTTPSYAVRLAELATELGVELRALGVRKGFFSGEAGLQIPGYRERIESAWNLVAHDLYGVAELGCQSGECEFHTGMHFGGGGLVAVELIDPASGDLRRMSEGAEGELVFTALQREACPLVRFRSHDFVRIYTDPCPCGRTSFRFHVIGRSDDMFVVKGLNVFPRGISEVLQELRPEFTGESFVVLPEPPPIDYPPHVYVEVSRQLPAERHATLAAMLADLLFRRLGLSARIRFLPQGCIASEHKTRRLYRAYEGCAPPAELVERVLFDNQGEKP